MVLVANAVTSPTVCGIWRPGEADQVMRPSTACSRLEKYLLKSLSQAVSKTCEGGNARNPAAPHSRSLTGH
ncbi:hypothetical protein GWK47_046842 [Chionoecetes opilio]|uniref:Uncharacterized protein n=1 Tax=Chionoecetes opilio TaxID=41210 RepID=A0A8J5CGR7_CHIOP|nr:hypothetical protein GWK47_046842 [Chionoecetes opilio]